MESSDVKRFGLILSIQAEIEGMKAENQIRKSLNQSAAYCAEDFQEKASELQNTIYCPEDRL